MRNASKFARRAIAAGCFAAIAMGAPTNANAGVLAQGVLEITNFYLRNSVSGDPLNESDFDVIVANHSTDGTATLNGTSANGTGSDAIYPFTLDMAQQSVGVNPFGQNDYSQRMPVYGGYFARTDTFLGGDSINYDISGSGTGATGVTAQVVGEVQLNASGGGSTQANLGLQADFLFVLDSSQQVQLDFDANDWLIAFLGPAAQVPGSSAQATSSWVVTLTGDDGTNFTFAPNGVLDLAAGELADDCSLNTSRSRLLPGVSTYSCVGSFSVLSPLLVGGVPYQLSIRHTIETDATKRVPEPGSLALLGAALLGFAGLRRKLSKA